MASQTLMNLNIKVVGPKNVVDATERHEIITFLKGKYVNAIDDHNSKIESYLDCDTTHGERSWETSFDGRNTRVNNETTNHFDSGFDLFSNKDTIVCADGYHMGFKHDMCVQCAAYVNGKPSPFYMYPRSSIVKTPLRLANSVGIIDSGYRGNLMGVFDVFPDTSISNYTIESGVRLLQICSPWLGPIRVNLVDELDETSRGAGGFGSTGR